LERHLYLRRHLRTNRAYWDTQAELTPVVHLYETSFPSTSLINTGKNMEYYPEPFQKAKTNSEWQVTQFGHSSK
jgi:hypothetical protein